MKVTQIVLEHSNPSMGPHETRTTVSLAAIDAHLDRINQFFDEAEINGVTSLRKYIEAVHHGQETLVKQVAEGAPQRELNSGATISELRIYFEEAETVIFYDVYRRHNLSNFYPNFTKYMVEHGSMDHQHANDFGKLHASEELKPSDLSSRKIED